LNPYDLFKYLTPGDSSPEPSTGLTVGKYAAWNPKYKNDHRLISGNMKLSSDILTPFLNDEANRLSLHVNASAAPWLECTNNITYIIQGEASEWVYRVLQFSGIKMMFYSGDTDGVIPTFGSK
jgi:hypothetical protein